MLLLLVLTDVLDVNDGDTEQVRYLPFDMYKWHYGKATQGIIVADICGRNNDEDNAFIHIRKEPSGLTEVVFWIYEDGFPQGNYLIKTDFGKESKIHKTQLRLGGKGKVLFLNDALDIIEEMKKNKSFNFTLIESRDTLGCYHYEDYKPLQWH